MDTDRNLLFGILALQADLIDARQFVEVCTLWSTSKSVPLADLLVERHWILPADREHLEYLLARKLKKCEGNKKANLASVPDEIKRSLAAIGDTDIQRSLAASSRRCDSNSQETVQYVEQSHERYSLTHLHAAGGIGRVWLARDGMLSRDVALKELRPERSDDATLLARFLIEAQITGQLEHPGIAPVYELARWPETQQPFYTMRFVRGRTLSEAIYAYHQSRAVGQVDSLQLLALLNAFVAVCNTVAYAHSRGVIHRDLKGQNIVLGDFGEVIVLDWGLAKLLDQVEPEDSTLSDAHPPEVSIEIDLTLAGQALGTPAYMAPEQAAGRSDEIDERTDVYGLGAMLYEILTGCPPFGGVDQREVLENVCTKEPAPPRSLSPDVPANLEAVCLRALAKKPVDRYQSAAELSHEVQQWQEVQLKKAEEALRASEQRFRTMVEVTPTMVAIRQGSGHVYFNPAAATMLGYSREELQKLAFLDYVHPDFRPLVQQRFQARLQGEEVPSRYEIRLVTKDGKDLWVDFVGVRIEYDGGPAILGVAIDVTKRKETEEMLREAESLYQSLADTAPFILWRKDADGRFTFSNKAFCNATNRSMPEIIGKTDSDLFPPQLAEKYRRDDAWVIETGKTFEGTDEHLTADGEKFSTRILRMPICNANGQVVGTQGIAWVGSDHNVGQQYNAPPQCSAGDHGSVAAAATR